MKPPKKVLTDAELPTLTPRKITALKRSNNRRRTQRRTAIDGK